MNNSKIILKKEDFDLLNNEKCLPSAIKSALIKSLSNNQIEIELTQEQILSSLDCLSDLLTSKGLKPTSEPNEFGYRIEKLIDVFNSKVVYPRSE